MEMARLEVRPVAIRTRGRSAAGVAGRGAAAAGAGGGRGGGRALQGGGGAGRGTGAAVVWVGAGHQARGGAAQVGGAGAEQAAGRRHGHIALHQMGQAAQELRVTTTACTDTVPPKTKGERERGSSDGRGKEGRKTIKR